MTDRVALTVSPALGATRLLTGRRYTSGVVHFLHWLVPADMPRPGVHRVTVIDVGIEITSTSSPSR